MNSYANITKKNIVINTNTIKHSTLPVRTHIQRNTTWPFKPFSNFKKFDESEGWFEYDAVLLENYKNKYYYVWYRFNNDEFNTIDKQCRTLKVDGKSFDDVKRQLLFGFHNTFYQPLKNDECANCGVRDNITNEHIHPVSGGGANTPDNKCVTCKTCNDAKANKFRIDVFNINKVHDIFVNKLNEFKIDYKTLPVEEVIYILRILYKSYLKTCQRIFNNV